MGYKYKHQDHLLPGLSGDEEHKESDDVDQDGGLDVVEQKELGSPPHHQVISDISKLVFTTGILLLVSLSPQSLQFKHTRWRVESKQLDLVNCPDTDVDLDIESV